jgi:hypothetical protein
MLRLGLRQVADIVADRGALRIGGQMEALAEAGVRFTIEPGQSAFATWSTGSLGSKS